VEKNATCRRAVDGRDDGLGLDGEPLERATARRRLPARDDGLDDRRVRRRCAARATMASNERAAIARAERIAGEYREVVKSGQ
jgi:hypothetical protein